MKINEMNMAQIKARLKERNEAAAANLGALGVEDPVERRELEERQRGELAGVEGADVTLDPDEVPGEEGADIGDMDESEEPQIPHDDFID